MAKKSIFSRIREAATKASEKIQRAWKKEKVTPPVATSTEKVKKSWIKRKFSEIRESSPWRIFKKKRIEELEEKIEELKDELELVKRKTTVVPFEEIMPEGTFIKEPKPKRKLRPEEQLINAPEFEFERGKMRGMMKYFTNKFEQFANGQMFEYEGRKLYPPKVKAEINSVPLADGSIIVQVIFSEWGDEDDFNMLTLYLESLIHSFGPICRVSLFQQWDPSKLSIPYDIGKGEFNNKTGYDFYKGNLDIAQNVSYRIGASFETARNYIAPRLKEITGKMPEWFGVRLIWGESVMRLSRKAVKI